MTIPEITIEITYSDEVSWKIRCQDYDIEQDALDSVDVIIIAQAIVNLRQSLNSLAVKYRGAE